MHVEKISSLGLDGTVVNAFLDTNLEFFWFILFSQYHNYNAHKKK